MKRGLIYIHGKGGNAAEAEHYRDLFADYEVIGFDYAAQTPWEANDEFRVFYEKFSAKYEQISIVANSIGAFFAMSALANAKIDTAYFISPIVNMEKLISDMLGWAGASEEELRQKGEIITEFGETLSWKYLEWVRQHPLTWQVSTHILCGSNDNLQSVDTIRDFASQVGAEVTVMNGGEHWFHTVEQMDFLDNWISGLLR